MLAFKHLITALERKDPISFGLCFQTSDSGALIYLVLILSCTHFCWEETTRKNRVRLAALREAADGRRVIWKESKGSVGSLGKLKSAFSPCKIPQAVLLSSLLTFAFVFAPHPSYQAQKGATCSSPILHFPLINYISPTFAERFLPLSLPPHNLLIILEICLVQSITMNYWKKFGYSFLLF